MRGEDYNGRVIGEGEEGEVIKVLGRVDCMEENTPDGFEGEGGWLWL